MNEEIKLLPCPFCGGNAEYLDCLDCADDSFDTGEWYAGCPACDIWIVKECNPSKDNSAKAWNTRYPWPAPIKPI